MNPPQCKFENFVLDSNKFLLSKDGTEIVLPSKAFSVLCHLVKSRGTIVKKSELLKLIWENKVDDGTLRAHIKVLRKALGDDWRKPQFIETMASIGYRFIAPVKETIDNSASVEDEARRVFPLSSDEEWYPDMRGTWDITVTYNQLNFSETLVVSHQEKSYFNGILCTPDPAEDKSFIYQHLQGKFVDRYQAFYSFISSAPNTPVERGTGICILEYNGRVLRGKSVCYGVLSQDIAIAEFCARKLSGPYVE